MTQTHRLHLSKRNINRKVCAKILKTISYAFVTRTIIAKHNEQNKKTSKINFYL